jgi:ABC-type transporter Mla subunit MlaD
MNQPYSPVGRMKKPPSGLRKGILVLGMHRSGTSALTRVLHLLGCQLPKQVMSGSDGNELGHWESAPIASFNDEVLASAGSSWDDWLPFNSDWYQSPVVHDFVSRGRAWLTEEFGSSPLFVLKDPRICRIANFWLEIFAAEGIEPAIVVPVRNPLEVGNSLNDRDMMEPGYAHLLWLRHILDAEVASRGLKRVFCTYDQLLENWPGLADRMKMGLGITWPRISASAAVEISSFLTTEQRHYFSSSKLTGSPISEWISKAYSVALRWSDSSETESDFRILDSIRAELDAASPAFAQLLLPRSRSGMAGDGSRRRAALETQLSDAEARLNAAEAGLQNARQDYENESVQLNQLNEKIADSEREIERLANNERGLGERLAQSEALLGEKATQLEAAASRLDELAAERDTMGHRLADVESTLRQREEEVAQVWAELSMEREAKAALQGEFSALERDHSEQLRALSRDKELVEQKLVEISSENEAATIAWEKRLAQEQASRETEKARADNARTALEGERSRHVATARNLALAQNDLAAAQGQIHAMIGRIGQLARGARSNKWLRKLLKMPLIGKYNRRLQGNVDQVLAFLAQFTDAELGMASAGREDRVLAYMLGMTSFIADMPLLDRNIYHALHRDVAKSKIDPFIHYLEFGQHEGRSPHPLLNYDYYTQRYPETERYGHSVLEHYLCFGAAKGYDPCDLFSTSDYLARYPDVQRTQGNPLLHYLRHPGCQPHPSFDSNFYLTQYPDVGRAGLNPLVHFLLWGRAEGRQPTPNHTAGSGHWIPTDG